MGGMACGPLHFRGVDYASFRGHQKSGLHSRVVQRMQLKNLEISSESLHNGLVHEQKNNSLPLDESVTWRVTESNCLAHMPTKRCPTRQKP